MEGRDRKIKVGISVGDPNGVGIELILRLFEDKRMFDFFTPIVFATNAVLSAQRKHFKRTTSFGTYELGKKPLSNQLNVVQCTKEAFETKFGTPSQAAGRHALASLKAATQALKSDQIDVLVTAPINKHNIQSKEFAFPGHTDYLADALKGESLMFMVSNQLRVGLLTDHIPVSEVALAITPERIVSKVKKMEQSLREDFQIPKPKIALLGINPHSGDNGVIGKEDDEIVRPTIKKLIDQGTLVYGPYASDSFFGTKLYTQFDAILASYHDQGLIPFKTLAFGNGVNYTAGLSKVRTSPDHGTAYDIAGKNQADASSFEEAMFLARTIYFNRREQQEHKQTKKQ